MPEKNNKAGKVKKPEIVFGAVFPAHHDASKIIEPSEEPLDFPTLLISAKHAAILRLGFDAATAPVRCDDFGAVFRKDFVVQSIAIISLVSDDACGWVGHKAIFDGLAHECHFSRGSTRCANGDRKTMAVRNCHDFSAFPALGLPDAAP